MLQQWKVRTGSSSDRVNTRQNQREGHLNAEAAKIAERYWDALEIDVDL